MVQESERIALILSQNYNSYILRQLLNSFKNFDFNIYFLDFSTFKGKIGRFGKSVSLHRLPLHLATRKAWIQVIIRKWKPTLKCSDHVFDGIRPNCSQDILHNNIVLTLIFAQVPKLV